MGFILTWIVLAAFWIGLSGYFDPIHLGFGAISVTLVSLISHRHLTQGGSVAQGLVRAVRTLFYVPWLLWQIVIANVEVFQCVLGFKPIEPCMVRIEPDMESTFGVVTLANSITLTPGTVTVDVEGDALVIHALTANAARGVQDGAMAERVKRIEGSA